MFHANGAIVSRVKASGEWREGRASESLWDNGSAGCTLSCAAGALFFLFDRRSRAANAAAPPPLSRSAPPASPLSSP
jgi:hypothetical protein